MSIRIESYISGKGGVGKSTISQQRAIKKSLEGYRVLVIDADIQGASSTRLLKTDVNTFEPMYGDVFMYQLFTKSVDFNTCEIMEGKYENLFVLPTKVHEDEAKNANKEPSSTLSLFVQNVWDVIEANDIDLVIVDTPPGAGTLQDAAIALATDVFLVSQPTYTETIIPVFERVRKIGTVLGADKSVGGIIVNMVQLKSEDSKKRLRDLKKTYQNSLIPTMMKHSVGVERCSENGWYLKREKGPIYKEHLSLMADLDQRCETKLDGEK